MRLTISHSPSVIRFVFEQISPWPYGSNPKKPPELAAELRRDAPEKNTMIYLSGFSRATNPQRFHIPLGIRVPVSQ